MKERFVLVGYSRPSDAWMDVWWLDGVKELRKRTREFLVRQQHFLIKFFLLDLSLGCHQIRNRVLVVNESCTRIKSFSIQHQKQMMKKRDDDDDWKLINCSTWMTSSSMRSFGTEGPRYETRIFLRFATLSCLREMASAVRKGCISMEITPTRKCHINCNTTVDIFFGGFIIST